MLETSMSSHLCVDDTDLCSAIEGLERCVTAVLCSVLPTSATVAYREVSSAEKARLPLTSTVMRSTCLVMNFLTLCCNASLSLCSEVSVLALLSTVARYAYRLDTSRLSCNFLTAFSSLGGQPHIASNKSMTARLDEISWELALSCPRSDILVACKSAHLGKSLGL